MVHCVLQTFSSPGLPVPHYKLRLHPVLSLYDEFGKIGASRLDGLAGLYMRSVHR
jgi:hypothetical protein